MKERLLKLLDSEQLSSSRFADVIGVQRSSVSHIVSGRNNPSFDFLQKTLKAFPMVNADWLILGEGEMYEGEVKSGGGNLFGTAIENHAEQAVDLGESKPADQELTSDHPQVLTHGEYDKKEPSPTKDQRDDLADDNQTPDDSSSGNSEKRISRIIVLYADNSFHSYNPA